MPQSTSIAPSDPLDPLPLGSGQAAVLRSSLPGLSSASGGHVVRMLFVKVLIQRFWRYHLLNAILPVRVRASHCLTIR